jgi:ABC-type antimicrobial peptide transport system ATPase subunit
MTPTATAGSTVPEGASADARKPVLEIRDLSIVYREGDVDVKAVDHVEPCVGAGRDGRSRRRERVRQVDPGARPVPALAPTSGDHRRQRCLPWESSREEGVEILDQSSRDLRKLRWREISIVFQSAMNALNPVLRIRDQLGDVLDAHLDLNRERSASASRACSTLSGSRVSGCAATRTSSRAACASGS